MEVASPVARPASQASLAANIAVDAVVVLGGSSEFDFDLGFGLEFGSPEDFNLQIKNPAEKLSPGQEEEEDDVRCYYLATVEGQKVMV